jgi:hypothetical protein
MSSWRDIEAEAADFAAAVRARFEAHKHHTLATLRKTGAPRISGTEVNFQDGELYIGSMWQARKARDLQRDARFALHSASDDPPAWPGDAKIAGRFEEITDPDLVRAINHATDPAPPEPSHLFRADIDEVVLTRLGDPADHLVIESWHAGRGLRRVERR